ncbi:MAG: hypothetical protein WCV73_00365 [Patescibacteria group bacterium]|jgi:hypothetical protein
MNVQDLKNIIQDIVAQADQLKRKFVSDLAPVNYACIFCQNDEEFNNFVELSKQIGKVIEEMPSGVLFQIEPLQTIAGNLQLLKIRKPDVTRPQRGDADFTLANYDEFKKMYLSQNGFKLINKEKFEMIELMDSAFNVRVYFSNPTLDKQLKINY